MDWGPQFGFCLLFHRQSMICRSVLCVVRDPLLVFSFSFAVLVATDTHITRISASQTQSWNASGSSISVRPDPNCIFHRSPSPSVSDIKAREKSGQLLCQDFFVTSSLPSVPLSNKGTGAHMSSLRYALQPHWKAHSSHPPILLCHLQSHQGNTLICGQRIQLLHFKGYCGWEAESSWEPQQTRERDLSARVERLAV